MLDFHNQWARDVRHRVKILGETPEAGEHKMFCFQEQRLDSRSGNRNLPSHRTKLLNLRSNGLGVGTLCVNSHPENSVRFSWWTTIGFTDSRPWPRLSIPGSVFGQGVWSATSSWDWIRSSNTDFKQHRPLPTEWFLIFFDLDSSFKLMTEYRKSHF